MSWCEIRCEPPSRCLRDPRTPQPPLVLGAPARPCRSWFTHPTPEFTFDVARSLTARWNQRPRSRRAVRIRNCGASRHSTVLTGCRSAVHRGASRARDRLYRGRARWARRSTPSPDSRRSSGRRPASRSPRSCSSGIWLWPAIFVGAFVVNLWTGAPVLARARHRRAATRSRPSPARSCSRRHSRVSARLDRSEDVASLIVLAAGLCTAISATIGVASLALAGTITTSQIAVTWRAWWLGDLVGALVVAPLLARVAERRNRSLASRPRRPRRRCSTLIAREHQRVHLRRLAR